MSKDKSRDIAAIRAEWEERAQRYDAYYQKFSGAVEHYVDWELLKRHLPKSRRVRILDAAGGTGRITLPLAKLGYPVTLCDISPGMLAVAKQKLLREGLLERVEISECDICKLHFADESFDFTLCWNGMLEAAREIIRVTKKGGTISLFLVNRCRGALDLFPKDPAAALALVKSRLNYVYDGAERYRAVSPEEARELFAAQGISVLAIYAVCGWMDLLRVPPDIRESSRWDEAFFRQVTTMVLRLSQESSVQGMSRHLVLYGKKI